MYLVIIYIYIFCCIFQYIVPEPVTIEVIVYICLLVSMGCLVLAFLVLFCFKHLQSNRTSIHTNLVFVFFLCALAFVVGVNRTDSEVRFHNNNLAGTQHKVQVGMCIQGRFKIRALDFRLKKVGPLAIHRVSIKDSDQTAHLCRLIRVFDRRTSTLYLLLGTGSIN